MKMPQLTWPRKPQRNKSPAHEPPSVGMESRDLAVYQGIEDVSIPWIHYSVASQFDWKLAIIASCDSGESSVLIAN